MRRRILAATLLAIAVTAVVLGLPLGFSALKLVEDVSRSDMSSRAQQIATLLDEQVATQQPLDLGDARILVPPGDQLVVRTPNESHIFGGAVGEQPLVEKVPMVQNGTVTLSAPGTPVRNAQLQVAGLVLLLVVLSAGTGMIAQISHWGSGA